MHSLLRLFVLTAALAVTTASAPAKTVIPPGISKPLPAQVTVLTGTKITLSITANGTAPLSYQWQHNGANITGATKSTYTITSATLASNGTYRILVNNDFGEPAMSSTILTVSPNYAGKYNMAVISYNPADLITYSNTSLAPGQTSGNALYGTATVSSGPAFTIATALKGYLGDQTGTTQSPSGSVSNGVVTINGTDSNLTINMVTYNGTVIGFVGTGTPLPDTDNTNDAFILGLNAATTSPTSAAACAGSYTMVVISYNAADLSTTKAAKNDGDAQIGPAFVTTGGSFSANITRYADSSQDTLGSSQTVTGTISSSGAISSVVVTSSNKSATHPISVKFVTLNGQVIGFTGTFKPVPGNSEEDDTGILIGIRGTFTPLAAPSP
jgi:hypothetical protein